MGPHTQMCWGLALDAFHIVSKLAVEKPGLSDEQILLLLWILLETSSLILLNNS